jgi:hypothetical protein
MNHNSTRSTLATVLAGAALLVAVGGGGAAVATGLANNSVESRHIKDGTIRSVDIANRSVTGADIDVDSINRVPYAETAGTADDAYEALHAGTAERLLGMSKISVTAAGTLGINSTGAVNAEQTTTPGRYVVTLDGPSLGCYLLPTVAHNDTAPVAGSASAWRTPPLQATLGKKVTVETHAPDGDGSPDPLPFNLLVVC